MKFEQFKVGEKFFASAGFEWLCTDKGTRTITAIMLDPNKNNSWFTGPPYLLNEIVFDEYDIIDCYLDTNDMLEETIRKADKSVHPNFLSMDVFKMMKEKRNSHPYPRPNLLKRDRVSDSGEILHPYMGIIKKNTWYIKTFELFSRVYSEIKEDDFKELAYSDEKSMKKRMKSLFI